MVLKSDPNSIPSNTPVISIPSDYYPQGCGFWFEIPEGLDAGKKIFYRDSIHGKGEPENTIVFIHGNPEASYTYRKVIKHLISSAKKPFRLVAMDHIGFGLSDQASFEMVCMDHANNLLQLIEQLNLSNVTLIIHDWGGPIGVGAFLKVPTIVSNLVLLNSTVFAIPKSTGILFETWPSEELPWMKFPDVIPNKLWGRFVSMLITYNPATLIKEPPKLATTLAFLNDDTLFENQKGAEKFYIEMFNSETNVLSSKRLVRQCPFWAEGNIYKEPNLGERDTSPFYSFIQENISKLWGPNGQNIGAHAVIGETDPTAKDESMQIWIEHLPQFKGNVEIFKRKGHFIEETKPRAVANAIIEVANLK